MAVPGSSGPEPAERLGKDAVDAQPPTNSGESAAITLSFIETL